MAALRRLSALLLILGLAAAPGAHADSVIWFTPAGAKLSGFGAFTTPGIPEAIRVSHTGGPAGQSGSLQIPLVATTDGVLDSVFLCYRTVLQDPSPSRITGIRLRTMQVPTSVTSVLADAVPHESPAGECLALDVVNQTLAGALTLTIDYTVQPVTFIEIGAIGLKMAGTGASAVVDPGFAPPTAVEFVAIRPNPARAGVTLDLRLTSGGRAVVTVLDVAGRRVRSLFEGPLEAGLRSMAWDGRDDAGRTLPPGVYLARIECAGGAAAERIVRID